MRGFEVSGGDFSSFRVLGGFLDGNMGKLVEIFFLIDGIATKNDPVDLGVCEL